MARPSPVRLVVALSVAAALAIFLLYVSVAGGTPSIQPSQLHGRKGEVALVGKVTGSPAGDAHSDGLRFRIRDVSGATSVPVVYTGSVPDLFKVGAGGSRRRQASRRRLRCQKGLAPHEVPLEVHD